jgi:cytoskeletal protein RodZ
MLFTHKKIKGDEETLAEKLRAAREGKKIAIEFVAQKLAINQEYLSALEKGDYSRLPAGVYGKTYLKKYGAFLGLNWPPLEEKYNKERKFLNKENEDVFAKRKISKRELVVFPKILRNILVILFVAALLFYLGYYLKNSFSQPKIIIFSPANNLVTENNSVEIVGQADERTQIAINNKQILKDGAGNFKETVELKKGLNVITISAQNKYSRKKIIEKQILVK